jgi:hypothetical protein
MMGIIGSGPWLTPIGQDPNDGDHLFTTSLFGIFRTTTGGSPWQRVATHYGRQWISMSAVDRDVIWTLDRTYGVRHTTDDGDTWTMSLGAPDLSQATKIHAHPLDRASAFLTLGGYATAGPHILLTEDFGLTWHDVTGNFPDMPANTFIVDPDRPSDWYVGADVGVWLSSDGGATWTPYGTGLANALVTDLEIRRTDGKLVAGTYGRGMWETPLRSLTSVEAGPVRTSERLMFDRPYPQPAGGPVTFRFAARFEGPVTLGIYDARGRRMASVREASRGDGVIRTIGWSPEGLPSGVYFAVLRAGEKRLTRKLAILRE